MLTLKRRVHIKETSSDQKKKNLSMKLTMSPKKASRETWTLLIRKNPTVSILLNIKININIDKRNINIKITININITLIQININIDTLNTNINMHTLLIQRNRVVSKSQKMTSDDIITSLGEGGEDDD